ncbi:hypothetical protein ACMA5I_10370 [Paracoccaceae bacterium GXU_MW_L88]
MSTDERLFCQATIDSKDREIAELKGAVAYWQEAFKKASEPILITEEPHIVTMKCQEKLENIIKQRDEYKEKYKTLKDYYDKNVVTVFKSRHD